MTDKEELKQAINTLKAHCNNHKGFYNNPCVGCVFNNCCQNRWSDFDTLRECMDGLLEDITITEKVENTDFEGVYDSIVNSICNNFTECAGCPFLNQEDDCPRGQLENFV